MRRIGIGALASWCFVTAIGCGESGSTPVDQGGGGNDSGTPPIVSDGGGAEEAPPPPPVGEVPRAGIFVSASRGADGADGSMQHPLKRLGVALSRAANQPGIPIVVCAETYDEAVTLVDGVSMLGYFDCSTENWKRVANHAVIAAPTSPAVTIENVTKALRFEGFDITAPDMPSTASTTGPAGSSYGMVIRLSKNIVVAEVKVRAGNAQPGADGTEPPPTTALTSPEGGNGEQQGIIPTCMVGDVNLCNREFWSGGFAGTSQCSNGKNGGAGGEGGDGQVFEPNAKPRGFGAVFTGNPTTATATTARGGVAVGSFGSINGLSGNNGPSGTAGKNGEWRFDVSSFLPGDGSAGVDGTPGQGGGGGGGSPTYYCTASGACGFQSPKMYHAATGGGGGAGGCGGLAGTPGKGGGASIGLLVIRSTNVTLKESHIATGAGGRGGKGALGTTGTSGGPAGNGGTSGQAYERGGVGGAGGNGGDGGPSGHGAPGPAIVLAYSGVRPAFDGNVELVVGKAGDGQAAMSRGNQGIPATSGLATTEHAF